MWIEYFCPNAFGFTFTYLKNQVNMRGSGFKQDQTSAYLQIYEVGLRKYVYEVKFEYLDWKL